jgi:hypothetical protein
MVQRCQPRRRERPKCRHLGNEGREQERLQEPRVILEATFHLRLGLAVLQLLPRHVMLLLQQRLQLLIPELLGIVELDPDPFRERLVARGDFVPQVADWDQVAEPQFSALLHEQGQHQLQRCPLALQDG